MRDDGLFPVEGIKVLFQDFKQKEYAQVGSPGLFIPFLSVIDALMNIGPEKTSQLIKNGTERWLTWGDMLESNRQEDSGDPHEY